MDPFKKAVRYISNGASVREAATKVGISITTLHNYLKKTDIRSEQQQAQQFNASQKKKIIQLRQKGHSYSEISRLTNVNVASVKLWCSDVVLNEEQKRLNLGALTEKQRLAVEYRKQGMYITEIAQKLGCAKSSVSLWLSKVSNEELHDAVNSRKNTSSEKHARVLKKNINSDKTTRKSSVAKNPKYGEFVQSVVQQRLKGMSFYEIGANLDVCHSTASAAFRTANIPPENLLEIDEKVKKRTALRRKTGELKPVGGVREGSGRSKSGYYKGIYCGSTYELCWVIHALDHGIAFKRFEGSLKKDRITYVPDFLLGDNTTIIELKGYEHDDRVQKKTELAESMGYTVRVLRKEDLAFAFDYVKEKYGVSALNSYTLYDNFKPKFEYTCKQCKKVFHKNHKPKPKNKGLFCSNICSGKFNVDNRIKRGSFKPVPPHIRKITDEQAIQIFKEPGLHREIAERYGVSKALVGLIKNKKVRQDVLKGCGN